MSIKAGTFINDSYAYEVLIAACELASQSTPALATPIVIESPHCGGIGLTEDGDIIYCPDEVKRLTQYELADTLIQNYMAWISYIVPKASQHRMPNRMQLLG